MATDPRGEHLLVRVKEDALRKVPGLQRIENAVIKHGPKAYKTASLLYFGREGGPPSKIELQVKTWGPDPDGGYDFVEAEQKWHCENDEVERLQIFLTAELGEEGKYELISADAPEGVLLAAIRGVAARPDVLDQVASQDFAQDFISALQVRRRRAVTDQLRTIVVDPASSERDLHRLLAENWWMFGGRYVRCLDRRRLTVLDELDLPLLRADDVLHLVELKRANIPRLVVPYRNHLTVGNDINEAVNQAANYLRSLDEQRPEILVEFDVDTRRAFATVVIGHPMHNVADVTPAHVREAIRTYNAHLSRIEIITYEELLESADNYLRAITTEHIGGGGSAGY